MNYKRFLAALTASFMVMASASCGEGKPNNSDIDTPAVTDSKDSAETEKATEKEKTTEKEVSGKTTEKKSEKTTAATEKRDKETKTTAAKTTKKTD